MMKRLFSISRYAHVLPRLVAIAALLALLFATQLSSVPIADASASGCTLLGSHPESNVCIAVSGSGLHVDSARAWFEAPRTAYCNTRLYITFFDTNNRAYDQRISSLNSGCVSFREYRQTYNMNMREGRVCGAVEINGTLQPGACKSIHK